MIHAAAANGWIDLDAAMMESVLGIHRRRRPGATYFAVDAARLRER